MASTTKNYPLKTKDPSFIEDLLRKGFDNFDKKVQGECKKAFGVEENQRSSTLCKKAAEQWLAGSCNKAQLQQLCRCLSVEMKEGDKRVTWKKLNKKDALKCIQYKLNREWDKLRRKKRLEYITNGSQTALEDEISEELRCNAQDIEKQTQLSEDSRRQIKEKVETKKRKAQNVLDEESAGAVIDAKDARDALAGEAAEDAQYALKDIAGAGAQGTVFLGFDRKEQREVAIKVSRKGSARMEYAIDEVNLLRQCADIPEVIDCYGYYIEDSQFNIVLERAHKDVGQCLKEENPFEVCFRVALALEKIHKLNIIHRDIKASNVLIVGEGPQRKVKLADFGCSKQLRGGELAGTIVIPSCNQPRPHDYRAKPNGDVAYDHRVDIFFFGNMMKEFVQHNIKAKSSAVFCQLADQCSQKKPDARPTIASVLDKLRDLLEADKGTN